MVFFWWCRSDPVAMMPASTGQDMHRSPADQNKNPRCEVHPAGNAFMHTVWVPVLALVQYQLKLWL